MEVNKRRNVVDRMNFTHCHIDCVRKNLSFFLAKCVNESVCSHKKVFCLAAGVSLCACVYRGEGSDSHGCCPEGFI